MFIPEPKEVGSASLSRTASTSGGIERLTLPLSVSLERDAAHSAAQKKR